jgi:hypothetical protein
VDNNIREQLRALYYIINTSHTYFSSCRKIDKNDDESVGGDVKNTE